ncbi:MAG TPA: hypothetical protein PLZ51_24075 [Aggregatilineales bacterium]|nr:hypothetical protein [Aggregatilineales bacterium]
MSSEPTTQPTVTQEQIDAVITTITTRLGGVFVTPSDIEPILQEMVNNNNALAPIANTLWGIAERMHQQQGMALTTVAMQTAMIEELGKQRDVAVLEAHSEGYHEGYGEGVEDGFEDGIEAGSESAYEDGIGTLYQGVVDNRVTGLSHEQIEHFSDVFYEAQLDDKAKQMLHDLIVYVWEKTEADMGNVEF